MKFPPEHAAHLEKLPEGHDQPHGGKENVTQKNARGPKLAPMLTTAPGGTVTTTCRRIGPPAPCGEQETTAERSWGSRTKDERVTGSGLGRGQLQLNRMQKLG